MHFATLKIVHTRNFSGPYFPTFGLNTEIYRVNIRIQTEYGKIRTRKNPNKDTFYSVLTGLVQQLILILVRFLKA